MADAPVRKSNTVRNVALGCLTVLVLLGLVGSFLVYRFVIRPTQNVISGFEDLGNFDELNARVVNTRDFFVPENGLLSEAQLERFASVQLALRGHLTAELEALETRLEPYANQENLGLNDIRELLGSARELPALLMQVKEAQVEALNEQTFSLEEYAWVRREVLRAAAATFEDASLSAVDLSGLLGEAAELPSVSESVPEANVQLLRNYQERLDELLGFSVFGF